MTSKIFTLFDYRLANYEEYQKNIDKTVDFEECEPDIIYTPLPAEHSPDDRNWPRTSLLRCIYCGITCDNRVLILPSGIRVDENRKRCYIHNNSPIHTMNCGMAQIEQSNYSATEKEELKTLLKSYIYSITGVLYAYIPPAPLKNHLLFYGGPMTVEEYNTAIERVHENYSRK